jgi:N-methylhydantoinase B/oxoprolinase/acetone carboxylase alpha subunit
MMGGAPGKPGTQKLVKRSGHEIALDGIAACNVEAGDRLELQTPGGGGYGRADSENQDECDGSAATTTPRDKKGEV